MTDKIFRLAIHNLDYCRLLYVSNIRQTDRADNQPIIRQGISMEWIALAPTVIPLLQLAYFIGQDYYLRLMAISQQDLLDSLPVDEQANSYRVALADSHHFGRLLTLLPWQALGVLVIRDDGIRLLGCRLNGQQLDLQFAVEPKNLAIVRADSFHSRFWLKCGQAEVAIYCAPNEKPAQRWWKSRKLSADIGSNNQQLANIYQRLYPGGELPLPFQDSLKSWGTLKSEAFAIESNPAAMRMVIAFFILLLYAVIDWMANPLTVLNWGLWPWLAILIPLVFKPFRDNMVKNQVPETESNVLAILVTLALIGAWFPASKHLGYWTSPDLTPVAYELQDDLVLHDPQQQLADIDYSRYYPYWQQFTIGKTVWIPATRGPLGMQIANLEPMRSEMRQFYRAHGM
jgi:hypothetical protein